MPRTTIEVPLAGKDPQTVNAALNGYFTSQGYTAITVNNEIIMKSSHVVGFTVPHYLVLQWLPDKLLASGFIGKPHQKEQDLNGTWGFAIKAAAKTALNQIAQVVQNVNTTTNATIPSQTTAPVAPTQPVPPTTFPEPNAKFGVISFVIGLVGILGALTGVVALGGLGIFLGIAFGISALKTKKRGFAIAGIILSVISIPILILTIIAIILQ